MHVGSYAERSSKHKNTLNSRSLEDLCQIKLKGRFKYKTLVCMDHSLWHFLSALPFCIGIYFSDGGIFVSLSININYLCEYFYMNVHFKTPHLHLCVLHLHKGNSV